MKKIFCLILAVSIFMFSGCNSEIPKEEITNLDSEQIISETVGKTETAESTPEGEASSSLEQNEIDKLSNAGLVQKEDTLSLIGGSYYFGDSLVGETKDAVLLSPDAKTMIYKYRAVDDMECSGIIVRHSDPNIPPTAQSLGAVTSLGSITFISNEILYISANHFLQFYHIPSQSFILNLSNEDHKTGGKVKLTNDTEENTFYITSDTPGLPTIYTEEYKNLHGTHEDTAYKVVYRDSPEGDSIVSFTVVSEDIVPVINPALGEALVDKLSAEDIESLIPEGVENYYQISLDGYGVIILYKTNDDFIDYGSYTALFFDSNDHKDSIVFNGENLLEYATSFDEVSFSYPMVSVTGKRQDEKPYVVLNLNFTYHSGSLTHLIPNDPAEETGNTVIANNDRYEIFSSNAGGAGDGGWYDVFITDKNTGETQYVLTLSSSIASTKSDYSFDFIDETHFIAYINNTVYNAENLVEKSEINFTSPNTIDLARSKMLETHYVPETKTFVQFWVESAGSDNSFSDDNGGYQGQPAFICFYDDRGVLLKTVMTDIPTATGKFNIPYLGSLTVEGANIIWSTDTTGLANPLTKHTYAINTNLYTVELIDSHN